MQSCTNYQYTVSYFSQSVYHSWRAHISSSKPSAYTTRINLSNAMFQYPCQAPWNSYCYHTWHS